MSARRHLRTTALGAAVAAGALLLASCTTGSDRSEAPLPSASPAGSTPAGSAASTAEPSPERVVLPAEARRPRNGACYRIGFEQATAPTNDEQPVRCTRQAHRADVLRGPARHGRRRPPARGRLTARPAAGAAGMPPAARQVHRRLAPGPPALAARSGVVQPHPGAVRPGRLVVPLRRGRARTRQVPRSPATEAARRARAPGSPATGWGSAAPPSRAHRASSA